MGATKDPKVWKLGPWFEALINPGEKGYILCIVRSHFPPGFSVSVYTAAPEFGSRIWYFPANAEITAEIIQLIAIEFEGPASELQGVYRFEGGRWSKAMDGEAGVDFLNVE